MKHIAFFSQTFSRLRYAVAQLNAREGDQDDT